MFTIQQGNMATTFTVILVLVHFAVCLCYIKQSPTPLWLGYTDINSVPVHDSTVDRPLVNTSYGPVQGVYLDNGVRGFLGVRYAAPPLEALRWEPPQPPEKWDMYHAVGQPPACPQHCSDPPDDCANFVSR